MLPKLTKLELRVMETLWNRGASSVRELHEAFPDSDRPAFTTVQTIVYRLEVKKALRRVKRSATPTSSKRWSRAPQRRTGWWTSS